MPVEAHWAVVTLLLLDTASLYFRAFYGVPESVTAPDGTPVNAIRGLLETMTRLLRQREPTRVVACLDADWRPAFRVAAIGSYKAHRVGADGGEDVPPSLARQVPVLLELLQAAGLATVGVAGFEADDVIGTLAHTTATAVASSGAGAAVEIVSGDRDLFQLVRDDAPVRVLYPGKRAGEWTVVDEAWLARTTGLEIAGRPGWVGDAYADVAILRGDPSDGLPGVAGVGAKTAASIINHFGSLAAALAAAAGGVTDGFPRGSSARIRQAREYLDAAETVVRIRRDVPLPEVASAAAIPADLERLTALAERWGVRGPVERLLEQLDRLAGAGAPPPGNGDAG